MNKFINGTAVIAVAVIAVASMIVTLPARAQQSPTTDQLVQQMTDEVKAITDQVRSISPNTSETARRQILSSAQIRLSLIKARLSQMQQGTPGGNATSTQSILLKFGDRGREVEALQNTLKSMSSIYPKGLVTGYYGVLTQSAVRRFQMQYGLEATGNVDRPTLTKIIQVACGTNSNCPIPNQTSQSGGGGDTGKG